MKKIKYLISILLIIPIIFFIFGFEHKKTNAAINNVQVETIGFNEYGIYKTINMKINSQIALCTQADKDAPFGSNSPGKYTWTVSSESFNNPFISKIIYYSISGYDYFSDIKSKSLAERSVIASKAISYYLNGNKGKIPQEAINLVQFCKSKANVPTNEMAEFISKGAIVTNKNVNINYNNEKQYSNEIKYSPKDANNLCSFTLPNGLSCMVTTNGNKKYYNSGAKVTIKQGDSFVFETNLANNSSYTIMMNTMGAINDLTKYTPVYDTSWQTMVSFNKAKQSYYLKLNFHEVGVNLYLNKIDNNNNYVEGAIYELYYNKIKEPVINIESYYDSISQKYINNISTQDTKICEFITDHNGRGKITYVNKTIYSNIIYSEFELGVNKTAPIGYYSLVEKEAPNGYMINNSVSNQYISNGNEFVFEEKDIEINNSDLSLNKKSKFEDISNNNNCYDISGAIYSVFGIEAKTLLQKQQILKLVNDFEYKNSDLTEQYLVENNAIYLAQFTVDENGFGVVTNINSNDFPQMSGLNSYHLNNIELEDYYYIAFESKAPDNNSYYIDECLHLAIDKNFCFEVEDEPKSDPISIRIKKSNNDKLDFKQNLEGTVFEYKYYDVIISDKSELNQLQPSKTWYFSSKYDKTANETYSLFTEDYLSPEYTSDSLYYLNGKPTLPIGTIVIKEIKAADNYILESGNVKDNLGNVYENNAFIGIIEADENEVSFKNLKNQNVAGVEVDNFTLQVTNEFKKGDFSFNKINFINKSGIANVEFEINKLDENNNIEFSLYTQTDENGHFDSKTNPIWLIENESKVFIDKDVAGNLPIGNYKLTELRNDNNKEFQLSPSVYFEIDENNTVLEDINNIPNPSISTYEEDLSSKTHLSLANSDKVTIVDKINYKYLEYNSEYIINTVLMEIDGDIVKPLKDDNGNYISVSTIVKADGVYDTYTNNTSGQFSDIIIEFSSLGMQNKRFVVYEYLYEKSENEFVFEITDDGIITNNTEICAHTDYTDSNQTGYFPSIKTYASNPINNIKMCNSNTEIVIRDEIQYDNLIPNLEYKIVGYLMNKKDHDYVLDSSNKPVYVEKYFEPKGNFGQIDVSFEFNNNKIAGENIVVFEELYLNDSLIAEHKDINDENQCIHLPKLITNAKSDSNEKSIKQKQTNTIIDEIKYENLTTDLNYVIKTYLVDKSTGQIINDLNGQRIENIYNFNPQSANGNLEVKIDFEFNNELFNRTLVVFEEIYLDNILIANHCDINSNSQAIYIYPQVSILKVNSKYKPVEGSILRIKDKTGNLIEEYTSTNEQHYIDLKPGIYSIYEIEAPNGYVFSNKIDFEVKEDGKTYVNDKEVNYVMVIDKEISKLPTTGGKGIYIIIIISLILIVFGIFLKGNIYEKNN